MTNDVRATEQAGHEPPIHTILSRVRDGERHMAEVSAMLLGIEESFRLIRTACERRLAEQTNTAPAARTPQTSVAQASAAQTPDDDRRPSSSTMRRIPISDPNAAPNSETDWREKARRAREERGRFLEELRASRDGVAAPADERDPIVNAAPQDRGVGQTEETSPPPRTTLSARAPEDDVSVSLVGSVGACEPIIDSAPEPATADAAWRSRAEGAGQVNQSPGAEPQAGSGGPKRSQAQGGSDIRFRRVAFPT